MINQPTKQLTEIAHDCPANLTNNCLVKLKTIKNGYAKKLIVINNSHGEAKIENNQTTKVE